jgi:type I restriction enzyme, S subunit
VPLPPLAEQHRIVTAIEEQFSRLAAAEASLHRARRNLVTFRSLVLARAFEMNYPLRAIGSVAEVVSGNTPKGLEHVEGGGIPFDKVGDMNGAEGRYMAASRITLDEAAVARLRVKVRPRGTLIFPKRGGAIATNKKRVLSRPAAFDLNTMGVLPGPDLDARYLACWFDTVDLRPLSDGSNVPQINHPDIAPLQLPVPPIAEQQRIVATLESQLSLIDAQAQAIDQALKRSAALRRAILERAFTGRLVPQDPNDEPAEVLLERIRSERPVLKKSRRAAKSAV